MTSKKCWVVKIGSDLIGRLTDSQMLSLHEQIGKVRSQNIDIIWVSSGARALGYNRVESEQPCLAKDLQALAAIGQAALIQMYSSLFSGVMTAQILVNLSHFNHPLKIRSLRKTIQTLLGWGALPILNENDATSTSEDRFADNDILAAMIAGIVGADRLIFLTSVEGLYDIDPRVNANAKLIPEVSDIATFAIDYHRNVDSGKFSRGGIYTKLLAAKMVALSGIDSWLVNGSVADVLNRIFNNESVGTYIGGAKCS